MSDTEHWPGFDREKSQQVLHADGLTDRRVRRTRQTLHETLMRLTVERGYDEISVADIAEAANVGRSTFYAHFTDKDDLLRSTVGTLRIALMQEHAAAGINGTSTDRMLGFSRFMTAHLAEQRVLYRALMRGRAGPIMMDFMRHALCDILRSELAPGTKSTNADLDDELAVQFLVGGYMSVLTWWLDRGGKEPPEVIEAGFRTMALKGLSAKSAALAS